MRLSVTQIGKIYISKLRRLLKFTIPGDNRGKMCTPPLCLSSSLNRFQRVKTPSVLFRDRQTEVLGHPTRTGQPRLVTRGLSRDNVISYNKVYLWYLLCLQCVSSLTNWGRLYMYTYTHNPFAVSIVDSPHNCLLLLKRFTCFIHSCIDGLP